MSKQANKELALWNKFLFEIRLAKLEIVGEGQVKNLTETQQEKLLINKMKEKGYNLTKTTNDKSSISTSATTST